MTTSKITAYASGAFAKDIVRIPAGVYPFFPVETIINLRHLDIASVAKLVSMRSPDEFYLEGELSPSDTAAVQQTIRHSRLIPPLLIKRC
jgi:hypothetical protein